VSPGSAIDVLSRPRSVAQPATWPPRHELGEEAPPAGRASVRGKFLFVGGSKFYVRGTTYGTFRPGADGHLFPDAEVVEHDMATMASHGVNTLRTYTVPPRWLLDTAYRHGLRVLVGLAWEQHVAFLDDRARVRDLERRVRQDVRATLDNPAVLGYLVGNEIPSSIVRWHGRGRVERVIEQLYAAAKDESPDSLVSYGNYPTTEYLNLPFLDFVAFNVYLQHEAQLEAYLPRLHNIAGDRPLLLTELGADSCRLGEDRQASTLGWQIRTAFASGCAGACIFAWTDEWHRGGADIEDWQFGLTDRERRPKPALEVVRQAYAEVPFPIDTQWPRMSVVVCTYNGSRTIRDCLDGLRQLDYPDFEVIVVDDGSTDGTADIAREYGCRLVSTENHGLSNARNVGITLASGDVVAFTDDDARPDPHWLQYLAASFVDSTRAGTGGPNIAPPGDGWVADGVANAPGGPMHVLLSDHEAEHIPGCNMAIRKSCLESVGGFDPQFRVAGDDVDLCWRLQQQGWTLGFSPAAMVWHHRRGSVGRYWKQQIGYGRAEALLERKWPEKYNSIGHLTWQGRLYGRGLTRSLGWWQRRIYHGTWGTAPFQSVYSPTEEGLWSVPLMPEWYLLCAALAGLGSLGAVWPPLRWALVLLIAAVTASALQAGVSAVHASLSGYRSRRARVKLRALVFVLHLLQPAARLVGRLRHGLTPWRERSQQLLFLLPWPRRMTVWNAEVWREPEAWLGAVETALRAHRVRVLRGGPYDEWDLEVRSGLLGAARVRMAVEEHGQGRQLVRFRTWPRCAPIRLVPIALLAGLSAAAAVDGARAATVVLGTLAMFLTLYAFDGCGLATMAVLRALPSGSGNGGSRS
jgi:GT2 family glycosyltransferase